MAGHGGIVRIMAERAEKESKFMPKYGSIVSRYLGLSIQNIADLARTQKIRCSEQLGRYWQPGSDWTSDPDYVRKNMRDWIATEDGGQSAEARKLAFAENADDTAKSGFRKFMDGLSHEKSLRTALKIIEQTPTGKALLANAEEGSVGIYTDTTCSSLGRYSRGTRTVCINPAFAFLKKPLGKQYTGELGVVLAHELFHAKQDRDGVLNARDGIGLSPENRMLATRHIEAGANAAAIQVAWEAKEAGYPELWDSDTKGPSLTRRKMYAAYGAAVEADPAAAKDGRALAAAYDMFFEHRSKMFDYDEKTLREFSREMRAWKKEFNGTLPEGYGKTGLPPNILRKAAELPNGVNPLKLDGRDPYDAKYTREPNNFLLRLKLGSIRRKLDKTERFTPKPPRQPTTNVAP